MPLVLRYLDVDRQEIAEAFVLLCDHECERGITGQAFADYVVNTVHSLCLRLADERGQCQDGMLKYVREVQRSGCIGTATRWC